MALRWQTAQAGESFASLRNRMLHNVTLLYGLIATPAVAISLSRAVDLGWRPFMTMHLALLVGAWSLIFLSGRITYTKHVVALLVIGLLSGLSGYLEIGPAADGKVLLISNSMLAALFLPKRWIWVAWSVLTLALIALAVAAVSGLVHFELDYGRYSTHPLAWANAIWAISLLAGVVAYVAREMVTTLAGNDARLRAMFNSMSEAIIVQSASGEILQANKAAHRLLGLAGQLRLNQSRAMTGLRTEDDSPLAVADLPGRAAALAGQPEPDRLICLQSDGVKRHFRFQTVPLSRSEGDAIEATVTTVLDVTEQVEAQAATEQALRATEAASRAKGDFLANVSHEIRTPMNAVIGMSHLLMGSALDTRQLGQVRKIRSAAEGLLGVLNDVLDFSKIEAGHLQLERTRFSLDQLLERTLSVVSPAASDSALELCVELKPAYPPELIGDPLRLAQVLINLMSNAIKFTEQGRVELRLDCRPASETSCYVTAVCQDTGIGITPDRIETIFQPFTQADGSTTRRFGGTGLGLSICARLVELMGGQFEVRSHAGHGSTFSFTLELALAEPGIESESRISGEAQMIRGRSRQDEVLSNYLNEIGFAVEQVQAGAVLADDVLARRRGQPTWWVVGDELHDRAERRWSELIHRELQTQSEWHLLLTSQSGLSEAMQSAHSANATVLERPVLPSTLRRAVEALGQTYAFASSVDAIPDLAGQQLLVVDDNAINREVVGEVLRRAGASVIYASNGLQAVRLVRASKEGGLPNLILMDLQMPIMDGLQAARCIREQCSAERLPIVALTAHAMDEERERVLAVGMQERLTKPVDPEQLLKRIAFWLGVDATRAAVQASTPEPTAEERPEVESASSLRSLPGLNYAFGLKQVMGNEALFRQMVGRFVERYADAGRRMLNALAQLRNEEHRRLLHSLKGMAATLGIEAIAAQALQLEELLDQAGPESAIREGLTQLDRLLRALADTAAHEQGLSK